MFDIGGWELLVLAALALIIVGPKDLPSLVRNVGRWVAKARGLAREFQQGMEEAARDAQDAHDAWQLAHDPAIPMFAKWYGEEWAREFAETVLFPGARERLASS